MKRTLALAALLGIVAVGAYAARTIYRGPLVYESGLAYNKNYPLNVANYGIDNLAATASYSSATVTAVKTFTDGTASTGSITVASNSNLAGKQATDTLVVLSTSGLSGSSIVIAGVTLTNSIHWWTGATTATTATSIKKAIIANVSQMDAQANSTTVSIQGTSSGTWCNGVGLSVVGTSSITAGAATFSGGIDNSVIAINNVPVVRGTGSGQWAVGASSAATANNIAVAINANSSLSSIVIATAPVVCALTNPCGVVKLTTLSVGTGTAYTLYSSSNTQLSLTAPVTVDSFGRGSSVMTGGTASATTLNSASITIAANPWFAQGNGQASMTGFGVVYSTSSAVGLSGLTWGTTYFIIPVDYNTIKLASSSANAQAGTAITIASSSTQTTAHSFTLTPQVIAGTPSFKWQVSNDGNLWQDFTTTSSGVAVSSVTVGSYTAGGASTSWDFGSFGYAWIRLAVISPTAGGLNLLVTMNGTSNSQ